MRSKGEKHVINVSGPRGQTNHQLQPASATIYSFTKSDIFGLLLLTVTVGAQAQAQKCLYFIPNK